MVLCNLAVLLTERGLTATKVAKDTGISRPTLSSLINNNSTGIQYDTVNKLCNYLNVQPYELLQYVNFDIEINPFHIEKIEQDSNGYMADISLKYMTGRRYVSVCCIQVYMKISNHSNSGSNNKGIVIEAECNWKSGESYTNMDFYDKYTQLTPLFKTQINDKIAEAILVEFSITDNVVFNSTHFIPFNEPSSITYLF
jgi:putative transcriptional regulator